MGGFTSTLDSWLCEYFAFWQSDYKTTKQSNYPTTQQLLSTRRGDLWVARLCIGEETSPLRRAGWMI